MNYCKSFCRTIQRLCNSGNDSLFDLNAIWSDIVSTTASNAGKTYTDSDSLVGLLNLSSVSSHKIGTVLAPGGFIYVFPDGGNKIYKFDTNTDTATIAAEVSEVTDAKYYTGVYAPDSYIYAISYSNKHIIKFDPQTDSYTIFGNEDLTAINKTFGGACALPDGRIICSPGSSGYMLIVDIHTQNITTYPLASGLSGSWGQIYLAPNCNLYSFTEGSVLKIVPRTLATSKFGWYSSTNTFPTIASDGKIYGINASHNYGPLMIVDTNNDTLSRDNPTYGNGYIKGEVLAPNGKIYCSPSWSGNNMKVVAFNPETITYTPINTVGSLTSYGDGKLAPNGYIYFVPNKTGNNLKVIKVNPGADVCQNFQEITLLSPFLNKF